MTSHTRTGCGPRQTPDPHQMACHPLPRGLSSMSQQDHATHFMMGAQVGTRTLQVGALHCLAHHDNSNCLTQWRLAGAQRQRRCKLRLLTCCSLSHAVCADAPLPLPPRPHVVHPIDRSSRQRMHQQEYTPKDGAPRKHQALLCPCLSSLPQRRNAPLCVCQGADCTRCLPGPEQHLISLSAGQGSACSKCIKYYGPCLPLPAIASSTVS